MPSWAWKISESNPAPVPTAGRLYSETKTPSVIRIFLPILTIKIFAGISAHARPGKPEPLGGLPWLDFQGRFQHPAPDFSGV